MLDDDIPGAQDTIYLCNFRVTVDGEWLCLKELQDVDISPPEPSTPSSAGPPPHMFIVRDPVVIERRNLVNISKLIVKELIETSLKYGRMLDSDHMPLQHFFIVLEHVLRHGLKPKKGLLGPKKELWDILQVVEKFSTEAQDITTSVRELPTVRTAMGRARAWLRLALMQKKLADYLKLLIDHKDDILADYYEPDSLMMSDESIVIIGLLVGLNVIDCNLCVKEEDLDCQQGVIDFSLYLRSSHHNSISGSPEEDIDYENMTTVLDQKNYIEELNRHLNATVGNLQAKVESLTTTNALMKEDLAIAKKNIASLMEQNSNLKDKKKDTQSERKDEGGGESAKELAKLKSELELERKQKLETEKELQLQISLKAEMEVALKLLEKDIHDKQDTIVSLRRQLDDIKQINLEMYRKLQECEMELTEKGEMVSRLQNKTLQIAQLLDNLQKCQKPGGGGGGGGGGPSSNATTPTTECETSLKHKSELITKLEAKTCAMTDTLQYMGDKTKEIEVVRNQTEEFLQKISETTAELKVEREWRQTLQLSSNQDREKISQLQQEVVQLKTVASKYMKLQEDHFKLSETCREQEQTLEELGRHLSSYKLQVTELKEEAQARQEDESAGPQWTSDKDVTHCKLCSKEFSITRRKHHCRHCGDIFCNSCSDNTIPLTSQPNAKPVRVCDTCHVALVARMSIIM